MKYYKLIKYRRNYDKEYRNRILPENYRLSNDHRFVSELVADYPYDWEFIKEEKEFKFGR